jgi:hypothetical protein
MTAGSLRKKIGKAKGLLQALQIVESEPGASGALQIHAGASKGIVAIAKGRIMGAVVTPTGERGEEALEKLALMPKITVRYSKFEGPSGQALNLPVSSVIKQLSSQNESNGRAQTSTELQTESVSQAPPGPRERTQSAASEAPQAQVQIATAEAATIRAAEKQAEVGLKELKLATPPVEPASSSAPVAPNLQPPASTASLTKADKRRVGKRIPTGALLGIGCLITLAIGLLIVPWQIKSTVEGSSGEQRAREWLKHSLDKDLSEDMPQVAAELDPLKIHSRQAVSATVTGASAMSMGIVGSEDLRFGRRLVSKGQLAAAIPYFESLVKQNPDKISLRLELINLYVATKDNHSARLLCIRTMKRQLTPEEMSAVWRSLSQCQTN